MGGRRAAPLRASSCVMCPHKAEEVTGLAQGHILSRAPPTTPLRRPHWRFSHSETRPLFWASLGLCSPPPPRVPPFAPSSHLACLPQGASQGWGADLGLESENPNCPVFTLDRGERGKFIDSVPFGPQTLFFSLNQHHNLKGKVYGKNNPAVPILTSIGAKCVTCVHPFPPGSGLKSKHSCHHPPFTEGETDPWRAKKLLQYFRVDRLSRVDLKLPRDSAGLFSAMTLIRPLSFLRSAWSSLVAAEGPRRTS